MSWMYEYICFSSNTINDFEKWCAFRASVGGVGGVLAWVACYRVWCACVGGMLELVASVVCLHGWLASVCSVVGMGGVLPWVACYYY